MTERDLDKNPYSADEERVARFWADRGVGGGDDPIGFMLTSYGYLIAERKADKAEIGRLRTIVRVNGLRNGATDKEIAAVLDQKGE